ncbi:MAG: hypothetical protein H6619_04975 [Deltaproteobacteria bacterium]|nr:hypothetical protein [Deltaproteobacteria bacterium]
MPEPIDDLLPGEELDVLALEEEDGLTFDYEDPLENPEIEPDEELAERIFFGGYTANDVACVVDGELTTFQLSPDYSKSINLSSERADRLAAKGLPQYQIELAAVNQFGDYARAGDAVVGFRVSLYDFMVDEDRRPEKFAILVFPENLEQLEGFTAGFAAFVHAGRVVEGCDYPIDPEDFATKELFFNEKLIAQRFCEPLGLKATSLAPDFPLNIKFRRLNGEIIEEF